MPLCNSLLRVHCITADPDTADMDIEHARNVEREVEELRKAYKEGGKDACRRLLERKRDEWKDTPLNVAVIGNSGVGKSSFINAIRRMTADDKGAAEVGVTETTKKIKSYSHPKNPMLTFWDLPGVGTDRFPKETYLSDIGFERFDFFLLITADRFTENDTWLGKEIRKKNRKYFFVRTKIGVDISNNKASHPKSHKDEAVVTKILEFTKAILRINRCGDVPVFLIDNYELMKFDFQQLEKSLVKDFPKLKRAALVMSLQATSKEMIQLKVAELRSRMWKVAAFCAAVATANMFRLSIVFDIDLVVNESMMYYVQLGLDEESLRSYATLTSTEYNDLKAVVTSQLGMTVASVNGIQDLVMSLASGDPLNPYPKTAGDISILAIPLIGNFIAAPITCYSGTMNMLEEVLDKMEKTAIAVVDFPAEYAL